jgi:hypothetical protein
VNTFPSSHNINHFGPTLLLYEVMLKDGKGHRSGGRDRDAGTTLQVSSCIEKRELEEVTR